MKSNRTEKANRLAVVKAYDLWGSENESKKHSGLHPSLKRSKKTPLPHPGQSYNPDPDDHQKLLNRILESEIEFQRQEALLNKAVKTRVDATQLFEAEREELVSGIKHLIGKKGNDDNPDSDGSSTDEAYSEYDDKDFQAIVKDKRVKEKRKSRQQRLKQLKDKLQRKAAKLRKLKNIRLAKFDSIKKINKELDKRDQEEASKRRRHRKIKNERLGQKFEKSDPIYCLTKDLPSNLRSTSCPMNAIVREQLESFQSRLMVEPTSYQTKHRKFKKHEFNRSCAVEQDG